MRGLLTHSITQRQVFFKEKNIRFEDYSSDQCLKEVKSTVFLYTRTSINNKKPSNRQLCKANTVCPGSLGPLYIVSYCIKQTVWQSYSDNPCF